MWLVRCWNFSWLNCVDLACVLGQFEGYNANLREFPEQVVRCVPAKPAQLELCTPAEVWLALLPPTIRSFRQSASKGKHTLQDDILNLSAFLLNGLTVGFHSKWDQYCQTMRSYLQISRWHKYSTLWLSPSSPNANSTSNSLFGVSKASLSAAISPPFFCAMMDQWLDNQADGEDCSLDSIFSHISNPLLWSSPVYDGCSVPSRARQWSYEIYAGVTFSMENAHMAAASTVNCAAEGSKNGKRMSRTHSRGGGTGKGLLVTVVCCVCCSCPHIRPQQLFISMIQFQGEGRNLQLPAGFQLLVCWC